MVAGWVDFSGGERPVAVLTPDGRAVMKAERPARLLLPPRDQGRAGPRPANGASSRAAQAGAGRASHDELELDAAGQTIFEALRSYRLRAARAEGVPPYVVASDRSLRELAAIKPRTLADLELAHGIGPAKATRYGAEILDVIRATIEG